MADTIRLRRGTASTWAGSNPILALGEKGLETDTGLSKTGDGVARWNVLPYDDPPISSRADAVAACAGGWRARNGQLYLIGGLLYQGSTGATALPGLPGLTWAGERDVRHFGAESGAADVLAAFVAARDSVPAGQAGKVIVPPGVWNISTSLTANNNNFVEWEIQDGASVLPSVGARISGSTWRINYPRSGAVDRAEIRDKPVVADGNAIGRYDIITNTGGLNETGYGERIGYTSSAYGSGRFDIATAVISQFNRTAGNGGGQSLAQWLVTVSPTTGDGTSGNAWGSFVAEWNIVNRGQDTGFTDRRSNLQNWTGGVQMVIEDDLLGIDPAITKNATFGFMFAGQTPTGNDVDRRRYYAGILGEPNCIAGLTGRALYWTGDTTGQTNRIPLAFLEGAGRWGHGLKLDAGTFDTAAIQMAHGHSIRWGASGTPVTVTGQNGSVEVSGEGFAAAWGSTRSTAVAAIAGGLWTPVNGRTYTIGGLQYIGQTGATAIADLPGLVPHGDWTFGHWGVAPSATATANTAAFRAAMDAVMAALRDQGGTGMTIRLQSGVSLVNNELLSDDFQSKWWAQTNLGKQKFINVEGDPAGTSEIRIDTSWLSGVRNTTNGNQRTSGPFSGAPSPAALWPVMANKDAAPAAFSLRNLRMRGTGTPGKDPIPLLVANELDARTIGLHVVNFANWGEVIMGSFNCAHVLNHFENCGTQPVESGRVLGSPAGYPSNTRVTFLNTAGTSTLLAKAAIAFDTYSVGDPVPFFEASHVGKVMVVHQGALSGGVGQPLAMTITSISGDKTTATYTPVNPSSVLRTQDNTAASFMPVTFTSTAGSAVINMSAPVILGRGAADMIGHMVAALKAGSNAAANMDTLVTRIVAVGSGNDTDGYSQLTLASTAKNAVTDVLLFSAGHACVIDEAFRASSLTWTVDDTDWLQCRYEHSGGYVDGNNAGSCQFLVQDPGEAVQYVSCKIHGANTGRGQFASEAHCVVDSSSGLDLIGVDFTHFSHGPGQVRFMGGRQSTRLNGVSLGSWQQPANWIGYYLDPPSGYAAATWHVIDDKQTRVKNNSFPRLSQALWGGRSGLVKANILDIRFNDQTQLWDEALLLTSADNLNDFVTPMLGYWQTSVPTNAPGPFPNYSSFKSEKYDDTVVQSVYDLDNRYGFVRERFSGSWTAWRFVGSAPSSNTVNMTNAANIINTSLGKHAGMLVRNTTDSKLYYATGSTATSTWVSADGGTTITPV